MSQVSINDEFPVSAEYQPAMGILSELVARLERAARQGVITQLHDSIGEQHGLSVGKMHMFSELVFSMLDAITVNSMRGYVMTYHTGLRWAPITQLTPSIYAELERFKADYIKHSKADTELMLTGLSCWEINQDPQLQALTRQYLELAFPAMEAVGVRSFDLTKHLNSQYHS